MNIWSPSCIWSTIGETCYHEKANLKTKNFHNHKHESLIHNSISANATFDEACNLPVASRRYPQHQDGIVNIRTFDESFRIVNIRTVRPYFFATSAFPPVTKKITPSNLFRPPTTKKITSSNWKKPNLFELKKGHAQRNTYATRKTLVRPNTCQSMDQQVRNYANLIEPTSTKLPCVTHKNSLLPTKKIQNINKIKQKTANELTKE